MCGQAESQCSRAALCSRAGELRQMAGAACAAPPAPGPCQQQAQLPETCPTAHCPSAHSPSGSSLRALALEEASRNFWWAILS